MVAADSDSGSEPDYSEPDFSDSNDDMGHVQPPLQNVRSSREIVDNFVRRGRGRGRSIMLTFFTASKMINRFP